jgi:hypothetical protein
MTMGPQLTEPQYQSELCCDQAGCSLLPGRYAEYQISVSTMCGTDLNHQTTSFVDVFCCLLNSSPGTPGCPFYQLALKKGKCRFGVEPRLFDVLVVRDTY